MICGAMGNHKKPRGGLPGGGGSSVSFVCLSLETAMVNNGYLKQNLIESVYYDSIRRQSFDVDLYGIVLSLLLRYL